LILYPFNPNWTDKYPVESFLRRCQAMAVKHGIAPERLVVLSPAPNRADVLGRLKLADIYLDSFPFSGATSLLDPLQAGLPSVVMDGACFRALVGPALLRTCGLDELVAADAGAYHRIACRLATDSEYRERLREKTLAAMQAVPKFLDPRWYGTQVTKILTDLWREKESSTTLAGLAAGR
jgi:predicted O-linked N-acetylglucosamine transferase (SPINDLY family)